MSENDCLFSILDYGAVPDGRTKNTQAISKAIQACRAAGGGTVLVPAGRYLTGPVVLTSNLTLDIQAGARLLFSQDFEDYPPTAFISGAMKWHGAHPCIFAKGCENIAVTGRGVIDGQGQAWWDEFWRLRNENKVHPAIAATTQQCRKLDTQSGADRLPGYQPRFTYRPHLLWLTDCHNILIHGVTLRNSPCLSLHPIRCENLTVHAVTLENPAEAPNADGIVPESCSNVRISDCHIDVGDDCITLKSGTEECGREHLRPCENVTVTNCTMLHGHGGLVIGSEMSGGVRNVVISNCIFDGTDRGIRIKSRRRRGGVVEDVRVSNIVMRQVICPFVINLYYGCGASPEDDYLYGKGPRPVEPGTPSVRHVHFSNITATDAWAAAGFFQGLPEKPIEGITFDNIRICMDAQRTEGRYVASFWGLEKMLGRGFICANVNNIEFNRVEISARSGPALSLEESENVELVNLRTAVLDSNIPAVELKNVRRANIRNCSPAGGTETFCRISGADTAYISLNNNRFACLDKAVIIDNNVEPAAVEA